MKDADVIPVVLAEDQQKAFPLGRWVHQQRRAYRAGELEAHRKEQLDTEGMVWEPGDEAWETKLAALRSYHRAHNHLAPRRDAVWGETEAGQQPVGQHLANLRRKGGLSKDAERAEDRARQLTAIDPDWACPWPLDWQRHFRVLADLVDADGTLPDIRPGVLFEGDDLGRWIERQARDWAQLSTEQQERLTGLGVKPAERPSHAPPKKSAAAGRRRRPSSGAYRRWRSTSSARARTPSRERTPSGSDDQERDVKLGIWVSNTKTRRDKLTAPQRAVLAELGVEWA